MKFPKTSQEMKRQYPNFYLTIYPLALFAFGFWLLPAPNSHFGYLSDPPRFLCSWFLGFTPLQFPPVWLPSFPRAFFVSGFWAFPSAKFWCLFAFWNPRFLCFSVLGFYPPHIPQPTGWLPSQLPKFFSFRFFAFTRPESPPVGCLHNPRAFFVFNVLGFTRPNFPGLIVFLALALSLFSVSEFYPPHIPSSDWLPSIPPKFFSFLVIGGYNRPKSPRSMPSQPIVLSLPSVFGVLATPISTALIATYPPRYLRFRLLGFHTPHNPPIGCLLIYPLFLRFRFLGLFPSQFPQVVCFTNPPRSLCS